MMSVCQPPKPSQIRPKLICAGGYCEKNRLLIVCENTTSKIQQEKHTSTRIFISLTNASPIHVSLWLFAGPIDDHLLKQLSADLGDEWKLLATHLNVKKTRIQSIMRNHVNSDNEAVGVQLYYCVWKRVNRGQKTLVVGAHRKELPIYFPISIGNNIILS